MGRSVIQGDHQRRQPAAQQAEQIPRTNLAVGGFQYAAQAGIVIAARWRSFEHVTQRLFKRIVHTHLG